MLELMFKCMQISVESMLDLCQFVFIPLNLGDRLGPAKS